MAVAAASQDSDARGREEVPLHAIMMRVDSFVISTGATTGRLPTALSFKRSLVGRIGIQASRSSPECDRNRMARLNRVQGGRQNLLLKLAQVPLHLGLPGARREHAGHDHRLLAVKLAAATMAVSHPATRIPASLQDFGDPPDGERIVVYASKVWHW